MDKMLMKLMEKKKQEGKLPENYKSAKMDVLSKLHKEMGDMIGEDLKGLKKVTVAAPDKEGLKMGLEKAEEVLESKDESLMGESDELCPECGMKHEGEEHMEEKEESSEDLSVDEIDQKIKELELLKKQKLLG